ncbi:kelch-like protein 21 isoform X1 [Danio rerio]|uniref:Kelch-like protein 21 n=3 Tax=Danio rerio TaxID=7955 RepID=KLH21_DANRE|nr:kelch-like protein 21 [Danio rerio]XP_005162217.1 kelch-like protein 21 isoform X1 [Danio rerio]XP_021325447.1 kelch-like protein 21 isoform X1 [Danio rerio]Q6NYM1.1 RecName: Full=Kelch-like protein 21 [Danio rerio]AAH66537.1 Kelch-like 21 (Drosophila) [Danio rerio]AAI55819.1 Klhl21 protein [Danio rerio]|eukprot:NP_001307336.1 kelch-like protein 21 [Danio rerio]
MEKPVLQTQPSMLPFFDTAHAVNLLRGIHELRAERKFFDVTLCAEGKEFHCHRTVLAAASMYFRAMFAGTLRESVMDRVVLHEVSAELLGLLVDFCYTGRVTVTHDNVDLLLKTADLFQFPSVKEACCAFLEQRLDVSNCLEIQDFAEAYACRELAASARRFVLKNIVELAKSMDFERLSWKRLLEFVSDDGLCVDKEETAYQIAVRWVKADLQHRLHYWPELLQQVRLPFVRRFYLLAHVESDPLVYLSPACLRLVSEARSFQSYEYDRHDRPGHRMRPRPSTGLAEILVVVGGCDQDCDELVTVDCYNPQTGQWRYLAEFPDHLGGGYSIAALGNDIYVTGGSDGSRLYDCVWRYNSSVNEWTEVSPMLKAREYHSSCVLKGQLYVVGSDSTERYDHTIDCWEALPPMPHPMDNCSTTACRGRLYAIGSLTGEDTMAIQCYDAESNRWSLLNSGELPPWSFAPKSVTLNGLIYFVRDDSAEVDVYNPQKNEWDKISPMTQVHVGGSVSALGGRLYVSGGYDNTFELSDVVEVYDPSSRSWSPAGRLPQPTFWHGSVSIFRQFMPLVQSTFEPIDIPEANAIHLHRHHRNQALHNHNNNVNQNHNQEVNQVH